MTFHAQGPGRFFQWLNWIDSGIGGAGYRDGSTDWGLGWDLLKRYGFSGRDGQADPPPSPISRYFCYPFSMKRLLPVLIVFGVLIC